MKLTNEKLKMLLYPTAVCTTEMVQALAKECLAARKAYDDRQRVEQKSLGLFSEQDYEKIRRENEGE